MGQFLSDSQNHHDETVQMFALIPNISEMHSARIASEHLSRYLHHRGAL